MKTPTVRAEVTARKPAEAREFRDAVTLKALNPAVTLSDFTEEEKIELSLVTAVKPDQSGYQRLLELRKAAYIAHVAAMSVPASLKGWAAAMAAAHGKTVKVWAQELGWLEALAVARYGEEPSVWPDAFDANDVKRAMRWAVKNRWPLGVERIVPGINGFARAALLVVLGIVTVGLLAGAVLIHPALALLPAVFGTALSDYLENEMIDHLYRARAFTAPTNHYFALFTAAPGETGGGTEVTGGSYARVTVAAGFANFEGTGGETTDVDSSGTDGQTENRNAITFPAPSANWGQATHVAEFDASSGGNMLVYGSLTTPKTINNGDPAPSFAAGAYTFTLA